MTDNATLLVEALGRAVRVPAGLPLHGSKKTPGLFASSTTARQAARLCKDQGLLHVVRTETQGTKVHEVCALTEKGLTYLLAQADPRQVLEDLLRTLDEQLACARQSQEDFLSLKTTIEKVLQQLSGESLSTGISNGSESWQEALLAHLAQRRNDGSDCPLPELYRRAQTSSPALTIGQFHDGLRHLHQRQQLYLHPWSGPLYDLPEPALALLVGHEIAYYASVR